MDFIVRPIEPEPRTTDQLRTQRRRRERRRNEDERDPSREDETQLAHHAEHEEGLGDSIDLTA